MSKGKRGSLPIALGTRRLSQLSARSMETSKEQAACARNQRKSISCGGRLLYTTGDLLKKKNPTVRVGQEKRLDVLQLRCAPLASSKADIAALHRATRGEDSDPDKATPSLQRSNAKGKGMLLEDVENSIALELESLCSNGGSLLRTDNNLLLTKASSKIAWLSRYEKYGEVLGHMQAHYMCMVFFSLHVHGLFFPSSELI